VNKNGKNKEEREKRNFDTPQRYETQALLNWHLRLSLEFTIQLNFLIIHTTFGVLEDEEDEV
jgi:hypothetical protein